MEICFYINGHRHCYYIPIYVYPVKVVKGPGPVNYQWLVADASLVASVSEAVKNIGDEGVRSALQSGINSAVQAMQKRAGEGVTINLSQGERAGS
jgi:hypothetical protein